jgi:hypothetical protein
MAPITETSTPGTARREGRGFVSSFGAGRKCLAEDCTTVLSRYNDASHCWLHDQYAKARTLPSR